MSILLTLRPQLTSIGAGKLLAPWNDLNFDRLAHIVEHSIGVGKNRVFTHFSAPEVFAMTIRDIVSEIRSSQPFGWAINNKVRLVVAFALLLQVFTLFAALSASSEAEDASSWAQEAHSSAKKAAQAAQEAAYELNQIRRSLR